MTPNSERFVFVDGLRGLAALMVTLFHLYNNNPFNPALCNAIPTLMHEIILRGWLGVQIFFVISGFVIAYSLRNAVVSSRFSLLFILRRSIRLDPPYWATIAVWIVFTLISNELFTSRRLALPELSSIFLHIFYLQHIFGSGDIVPVFWTLCFEVQFYLIFIALLRLFSYPLIKARKMVFGLVFIGSGLLSAFALSQAPIFSRDLPYNTPWCFLWWHFFVYGALIMGTLKNKSPEYIFWMYTTFLGALLALNWREDMAMGLLAGLLIYGVGKIGKLKTWLRWRGLQFLGKISYSLYLLHFVVGCRILNLAFHYIEPTFINAIIIYIIALMASIASAMVLYYLLEKPSLRLAAKIKKMWERNMAYS